MKHYALIILLSVLLLFAVNTCSTNKHTSDQYIEALTDSVSYYRIQNDQLVATKLLVQSEYDKLKKINTELYDRVQDMEVRKPDNVVYIETVVENVKRDTVIVSQSDTVYFDFSDAHRTLQGTVYNYTDSTNISIDKDEVYVDYTLVTKDDRVYVTSDNPYVIVKNIDGIVVPKTKKSRWAIGPSIGVSYDVTSNKFVPTIGIGITYSLF